MKKRLLIYLFLIIVCSTLYFYFTRQIWLNKISENLLIDEEVKKSDVIICPGGWSDYKSILYCLDFINKGYARKIIFLGDRIKFYNYYETWASLGEKFALKYGCKKENIIINERPSSTYEEALISRQIMDKNGMKSAIVVISPFHMLRTKKTFFKIFNNPKYKLYFAYPPTDPYYVHSWWLDEDSTVKLFNEYVKIIWYKYKYNI